MMFALKTEKGVSSCGGLLVSPIIGRFCGYLTSGRVPFSNGSTTVSTANAREDGRAAASAARPVRLSNSRRPIMAPSAHHFVGSTCCSGECDTGSHQVNSPIDVLDARERFLSCKNANAPAAVSAAGAFDVKHDQ